MLFIRPHHINCIFFFRGLGYNFEFTSNMKNIVSHLRNNPDTIIKLVSHCDSFCECCPNKTADNICIFQNNVSLGDSNALQCLDLEDNHQYSFKEIINTIYKNYNNDTFLRTCSGCDWAKQGVCTKELIAEHKKIWLVN